MDKLNQQLNRAGLVIDDEEGRSSSIYHMPLVERCRESSWIKYVPFLRFYEKSIFTLCRRRHKVRQSKD